MIARAGLLTGVAAIVALTTVSAQGGGKPTTGNPTPGTAQPDAPNLADRVTIVGCLRPAARRADASGPAASADPNTPSNRRFELTNAERVDRVPPGTGGSAATTIATSRAYRLEGIDSQFSPFVGARVEISGEIRPVSAAETTTPPTLLVEFVQRLAAKCP